MPPKEAQTEKPPPPKEIIEASEEIGGRLRKLDEHLKRVLGKLGRDSVSKKNEY